MSRAWSTHFHFQVAARRRTLRRASVGPRPRRRQSAAVRAGGFVASKDQDVPPMCAVQVGAGRGSLRRRWSAWGDRRVLPSTRLSSSSRAAPRLRTRSIPVSEKAFASRRKEGRQARFLSVRRPPSIPLRVLRGFVVLVTVWCTGCSGFEPLLDAALGGSQVGMVCASEESGTDGRAQRPASAAAANAPSAAAVSAAPASTSERGFNCSCSSCHSVTIASWSFTPLAAPLLPPAFAAELPLVSVGRSPLLPPPERTVS